MKYLFLTSCFLLFSCSSAYKTLVPVEGDPDCLKKFKPQFTTNWYEANIDVMDNHISGLMLFKLMPDSSMRIAFTSKSGLKFLDFEFSKNGRFTSHYVIDNLNRKSVINTLRKDFEIILMQSLDEWPILSYSKSGLYFYAVPDPEDDSDYYVTSPDCTNLVRVEKGGRKKVLEAFFSNYTNRIPGEVTLSHTTFNMKISLIKLDIENANQ